MSDSTNGHTIVLGINAYHGDSSACLIIDGEVIGAVEEERFRRIKHWAGFPSEAIKYCVDEANIRPGEIDHISISRNPLARLPQKVWFALSRRPSLGLVRSRLSAMRRSQTIKDQVARTLNVSPSKLRAKVHGIGHHRSHSASAFLVSPFEEAAVVSIDAFGDFQSTLVSLGTGNQMRTLAAVGFPHSLGILYTAVTQYLGFPRYGDEYKVMGLAAYGEPTYLDEFRSMVRPTNGGTFALDLKYFLHASKGVNMTWDNCEPEVERAYSDYMVQRLGPARDPGEPLTQRHNDMAASLQAGLEEVYFHVLNYAHEATGMRALTLAGGVAFNSVANGKIFDNTPFEDVYIQAAAGDAGTAMGSASYVYHQVLGNPRNFVMSSPYWGPHFDGHAIESALSDQGLDFTSLPEDELVRRTAEAIAEGKIVGWFQGRVEWGPRALGNRSILVDPRRAEMKDVLNQRIKRREAFRPYAPSVLEEAVGDYFERSYPDPFMIKVYPVRPEKRDVIPAVTHVDGTGRLQTVSRDDNPRYWKLISEFQRLTGVPLLLNTSFNENEPIVCSPQEAIDCFLRTRMDILVLEDCFVEKTSDTKMEVDER